MKKRRQRKFNYLLLMLAQDIWKQRTIDRFFAQPLPVLQTRPEMVSLLQPVLSGDPTMIACLERSLLLRSKSPYEVIWLIDQDDSEGQRICQELKERYPEQRVRLVLVPPPPENCSPKTFKLIEGHRVAQGDIICVLDDDTLLPENGLDIVLPYLDQPRVGLAFGLPYYVNFANIWSSMVSIFVNSNSLLSYIPYTSLTEPFTINGMFYMLRRDVLDSMGGFEAMKGMFADDFGLALLCRSHGYKLVQTPLRHGISTQVQDVRHYVRLLQRWFILPRVSVLHHLTWFERLIFSTCVFLPTVFPLFLVLSLLLRPRWLKLCYTVLYFGGHLALIRWLNSRYLQHATPENKFWLVPIMMILIPIQMIVSLLSPSCMNWRGNVVKVMPDGTFEYIRRRV